ncbi:MAG: hypothetical protein E4H01_07770 [Lysobacterales bacterium]|nr:MAG: hypothetical protein E4H01_07770 [Xanthomonadales bacterium]
MKHVRMTALIVLAALLMACAQEVIHLAQLDTGMTRKQVEEVQGKPDNVKISGNYTALRYGPNYFVILDNDRVIAMGVGTIAKYPGTDRYFIDESYP